MAIGPGKAGPGGVVFFACQDYAQAFYCLQAGRDGVPAGVLPRMPCRFPFSAQALPDAHGGEAVCPRHAGQMTASGIGILHVPTPDRHCPLPHHPDFPTRVVPPRPNEPETPGSFGLFRAPVLCRNRLCGAVLTNFHETEDSYGEHCSPVEMPFVQVPGCSSGKILATR